LPDVEELKTGFAMCCRTIGQYPISINVWWSTYSGYAK